MEQPEPVDGTKTVMVVGPHPDDAESGAGGTIAAFVAQGAKVIMVVCTTGDKGTSDRSFTNTSLAATRRTEQEDAAKVLGVHHVAMLGYPDQGLEDNAELRGKIVREMRIHRPDIVFTMDPSRPYIIHRDHRMTGRVTLDAIYPSVRDHMSFPEHIREGLEPLKIGLVYLWGTGPDGNDAYFDISDTLDVKFKALFAHRSQFGDPGDESRMAQRRKRFEDMGKFVGVRYAEGFKKVELGR